jgi:heat shock protein HslJ
MKNNKMKQLLYIIAIAGLALLGSCDSPIGPDPVTKTEIQFETVVFGADNFSFGTDTTFVIRSREDAKRAKSEMESRRYDSNGNEIPFEFANVDFQASMLIGISLSERASSDWTVRIEKIEETDSKIIVSTKEYRPENATFNSPGYPAHIVKIAKSEKTVEFLETEIEHFESEGPELHFESIMQGQHIYNLKEPQNFVIRNESDQNAFMQLASQKNIEMGGTSTIEPFPEVNYDSEMAIVVHGGRASSGSIWIEVESVILENEEITVHSKLYYPGIGTDDIGYPMHIIKLKKYNHPVNFAPTETIELPGGGPESQFMSEIADRQWQLESYVDKNHGDFNAEMETGMTYDLVFHQGGYISGFAGCNNFEGSYEVDGELLTIDVEALTKEHCLLTVEFIDALNRVQSARLEDGKLVLVCEENDISTASVLIELRFFGI